MTTVSGLGEQLEKLRPWSLPGFLHVIASHGDVKIQLAGKEYLHFCSFDAFGLNKNRAIRKLAAERIELNGMTTGLTPHLAGRNEAHLHLERRINAFQQTSESLLFSSASDIYSAVISSLCEKEDVLLCTTANGHVLGNAQKNVSGKTIVFSQSDPDSLAKALQGTRGARRRVVFLEGVSSQFGCRATIERIVEIANSYGALLVLDETVSLGIIGPVGAGLLSEKGLLHKGVTVVFRFDSSLSALGGCICGDSEIISLIRDISQEYRTSPVIPSFIADMVGTAIDFIEVENMGREKLKTNACFISSTLAEMGFKLLNDVDFPFICIKVQDQKNCFEFIKGLFERGVIVTPGFTMLGKDPLWQLRINLSVLHESSHLTNVLQGFEEVGKRLRLLP